MNGDSRLYELLTQLNIVWEYYEHPPAPTIAEAVRYWKDIECMHCKNLFFRNHKGNRHYLVIIPHTNDMNITDLEKKLKQGKLSFASPERMMKYLGVRPGSVSPLALIHDHEKHVHVFLDQRLRDAEKISFHPCINTASLVIQYSDFVRFLNEMGNTYEYCDLSDG